MGMKPPTIYFLCNIYNNKYIGYIKQKTKKKHYTLHPIL